MSIPIDMAGAAVRKKTFIRVVEVWVPDSTHTLLEFGGGIYTTARRFGAASRSMCFGRGEGLPGLAWDSGRPIVLKQFEGSYFRRTQAATAEGLTCGIAVPVFAGDLLTSVMVMFCGDDDAHAGAVELWHNDAANSPDLLLDDGYYGTTGDVFEFMSRQTAFRKGSGLPGLAWESGLPVFMPDLGKGTRFLRSDSAVKVGINRGFAIPCSTFGKDFYVLAFLSALATPLVRRFEIWQPNASGSSLQRKEGFCESAGVLGATTEGVDRGKGLIGKCLANCAAATTELAGHEPGVVGLGARDAGLEAMLVLPVLRDGRVAAVVALYF